VRVLALTPDFPPAPGGIQQVVDRVARHASRMQVRVVTPRSPGWQAFDRVNGLDVRRVRDLRGGRASKALLNAAALKEALAFRPDAVLSAHIVVSPAARAIQRLTDAPYAQYVHADELRARPGLASFALRHADAVVAVSAYAETLAIDAGARAEQVRRIPNGVDVPRERRAERAPEPTLLTVARLNERYKGFDVIVRALPLIRAKVPTARWVIVGDGPLRPHLEDLVRSHGLEDAVLFAGSLSDEERDRWLDRAHVFLMPSRLPATGRGGEGFGIAYLEASARGLPVVAGNVGGAPEAVSDGETGLLVDPTDHLALAAAVSGLLADPARANALGRAGQARARELAWPVVAGKVEDLLLRLADHPDRGRESVPR
jgi:phosphatidylinositol alpha-1,6-mannosyltransferase